VDEDVIQIQKSSKDQSFHLITNSGVEYHSQSVILSTGAQSLWLNAKNEDTFKGQHPHLFPVLQSLAAFTCPVLSSYPPQAKESQPVPLAMDFSFGSAFLPPARPLPLCLPHPRLTVYVADRIKKSSSSVEGTQHLKKLSTSPTSAPRSLLFIAEKDSVPLKSFTNELLSLQRSKFSPT
jgi:hypothetical protein